MSRVVNLLLLYGSLYLTDPVLEYRAPVAPQNWDKGTDDLSTMRGCGVTEEMTPEETRVVRFFCMFFPCRDGSSSTDVS